MFKLKALFLGLMTILVAGVAPGDEEIPNWPAPATWSPHSASRGVSTMGAITSPLPFIGLTPCRIADTRNAPGPYGAPALAAGVPRNFALTGQCGIPTAASAASLNLTVTNTQGPGFILIYPQGGSQPNVSTLNYVVGQTIANAAVVPLGAGGGITVIAGVSGTDLIIDINGYYGGPTASSSNVFLGDGAGNTTMTGTANTAIGVNALAANTTGGFNMASGAFALSSNTTSSFNTASGSSALQNNTSFNNTASGVAALFNNTTGSNNTASGATALFNNTTGANNIGIGSSAGSKLSTGSNNICIGNEGVAGESSTIRVGTFQTKTFIAGVVGVTTGGPGIPVLIDGNGQLGTISSSARFKDEIQDMGEATEGLLKLRPVMFRYKAQPEGRTQFGLIAEEVEKVMPELVVCSSSGEAETVLYHEMPSMLLNELQKQQRQIDELKKQQRQMEELKSELAALRAVISQK